MPAHPVTIGLLGDVMLGRGVAKELERVAAENVWSAEVRELAASCDLVVCNLECCISERGEPTELVPGKPFFFRGPPNAVESLQAIRVNAVSLANNHALDFGPEALADTLSLLDDAAIYAAGAGSDLESACSPTVIEAGEVTLALVAVSDHPREFAAGPDAPGIAYADLPRGAPDRLLDEVRELSEEHDLVIAFPHWGPNMTPGPAHWQQALARDLLGAGADAVAGHSAHVFHGIERRPEGIVIYDLGDALDDYAVDAEMRNDLGIVALWRPGSEPELELVGLRLDYCHTRFATGDDADWIASRLARACSELGTTVERSAEQRFALVPARP